MKILSILIISTLMSTELNIDFGSQKNTNWYSINDGVMGGKSSGTLSFTEESLVYKGSISFANNGGFASVRSNYAPRNLSNFKTVQIRYKAEGQSVGFVLESSREWYLPNYKWVLEETNGKWRTAEFELTDLDEYRVGKPTGKKISSEILADIIRYGLITNDKKEGSFEFQVDFIKFL